MCPNTEHVGGEVEFVQCERMTGQSRWRGLLIQLDQADVWCAVVPQARYDWMCQTYCGRAAVFYQALTTGQPPTCPKCVQAMGVVRGN